MAKTVDTVKRERVYSNEISFIRCAKDKKEEKGITLVALVITIVILIILATITINLALGEGGLIDRAQDAKDLTEQATRDEQEQLDSVLGEIDSILEENQETVECTEVIYVTLYTDGTLGFSSTTNKLSNKTPAEGAEWEITPDDEFSINEEDYNSNTPWNPYKEAIREVVFADEIVPASVEAWFAGCSTLTSIDLTNLNTINATDMSYMFYSCQSLSSITFGADFNTINVTNMKLMFAGINQMTSLDLSTFNTSNVTNMDGMFNTSNFQSINILNFDTSKVTNMEAMFYGCWKLTSLEFGANFKTNEVTNMAEMFTGCQLLTSLDLQNFDTSKVQNMASMFFGCTELKEILVNSETWYLAPTNTAMFEGCGVSSVTEM